MDNYLELSSLTEQDFRYLNNDEDYAFGQAIYVLIRRKVIRPTGDGRYELAGGHRDLLGYYRDTIAHYIR